MLITFRSIDRWLLAAVLFLAGMGLMNLAGMPQETRLFAKQIIFIGAGILLIIAVASFDYRFFRSTAVPGMAAWGLGIALLLGALVTGARVRGAANWLFLGPFSIGPIEVVKLGVLLTLAHFFAREHRRLVFPKRLIVSALFVAAPVLLTLLQPDLGSTVVLGALWFFLVVLLGVPLRTVVAILVILAAAGGVLWQGLFQDYQKDRILSFVNPAHDPLGAGYQSAQAMMTIGSGGIFGKGFFASDLASRLAFLPESATDFAFASLVEKSGLLGALAMLGAFIIILMRVARTGRSATNNFSFAYALGLFVLLATETILNIGMNLRLLPVTGQPLPFVSYGGSHLLITFLAVGLLESVRLHQPEFLRRREGEPSAAFGPVAGDGDAMLSYDP